MLPRSHPPEIPAKAPAIIRAKGKCTMWMPAQYANTNVHPAKAPRKARSNNELPFSRLHNRNLAAQPVRLLQLAPHGGGSDETQSRSRPVQAPALSGARKQRLAVGAVPVTRETAGGEQAGEMNGVSHQTRMDNNLIDDPRRAALQRSLATSMDELLIEL